MRTPSMTQTAVIISGEISSRFKFIKIFLSKYVKLSYGVKIRGFPQYTNCLLLELPVDLPLQDKSQVFINERAVHRVGHVGDMHVRTDQYGLLLIFMKAHIMEQGL